MSEVYKKHTEWRCTIDGECFAINAGKARNSDDIVCEIEELRKNGQEDCHQAGILILLDGRWEWCEGKEMFDRYGIGGDAIVAFLNANPPPMED